MRNFRALSKSVEFHPCASAQGRDSKEDEGVRYSDLMVYAILKGGDLRKERAGGLL